MVSYMHQSVTKEEAPTFSFQEDGNNGEEINNNINCLSFEELQDSGEQSSNVTDDDVFYDCLPFEEVPFGEFLVYPSQSMLCSLNNKNNEEMNKQTYAKDRKMNERLSFLLCDDKTILRQDSENFRGYGTS